LGFPDGNGFLMPKALNLIRLHLPLTMQDIDRYQNMSKEVMSPEKADIHLD